MDIKASIELTPELMAIAFWNWEDSKQCQFFEELNKVISEDYKTNKNAYSLGEMQWLYMGDCLNKNPKAKEMACAMLASIYLHATNFLEKYPSHD